MVVDGTVADGQRVFTHGAAWIVAVGIGVQLQIGWRVRNIVAIINVRVVVTCPTTVVIAVYEVHVHAQIQPFCYFVVHVGPNRSAGKARIFHNTLLVRITSIDVKTGFVRAARNAQTGVFDLSRLAKNNLFPVGGLAASGVEKSQTSRTVDFFGFCGGPR